MKIVEEKIKVSFKGKVWHEHHQFNAQVPVLFMEGVGQNADAAIKNLIESYHHYIDTSAHISFDLREDNAEFILCLECEGTFFDGVLESQKSAYQFKRDFSPITKLQSYYDALECFVGEAKRLIRESQT